MPVLSKQPGFCLTITFFSRPHGSSKTTQDRQLSVEVGLGIASCFRPSHPTEGVRVQRPALEWDGRTHTYSPARCVVTRGVLCASAARAHVQASS